VNGVFIGLHRLRSSLHRFRSWQ